MSSGREGRCWLGIDVGTQGCRAVVVSDGGEVVAAAQLPLGGRRGDGRHEQRPEDWWEALAVTSRAALAAAPEGVAALAICATSGTIVLADDRGRPHGPGLMYDDARAVAPAERVRERTGEVWAELGVPMQTTWALPKLLWLLDAGGKRARGLRLRHVPDFLGQRLVGHPVAADESHALKTGYDVLHRRWPADAMDRLGVPAGVLPDVVPPGTELGRVSTPAAEATGIPAGTPLLAGMTDGCASQIAAGALRPGRWMTSLGTTLVLKGVTSAPVHDPDRALYGHRHPDSGWLPGGASSVGAGALADAFSPAELQRLAAAPLPDGPGDVVAYPLVGRGERFPFVNAEAEPFVLGEPRSPAERYRALLEGVAYVERMCLARIQGLGAAIAGPVATTGGGTANEAWCRLRADILGRPLEVPLHPQAAVGMAILAAAGSGSVTGAAERMVRVGHRYEPDRSRSARYAESYRRLADELERRGWLAASVAAQVRAA